MINKNKIIKSHIHLCKYLNSNIINILIHLFDKEYNNYVNKNEKVVKYIINERKIRGLEDSTITIESELYGNNNDNINNLDPTLFLNVKKNNIDLVHLSIHLCIKELKSTNSGIIHMRTNYYLKTNINKSMSKKTIRKCIYANIEVKQPIDKPNSLEFIIADGYNTPIICNASKYDPGIQKEMDVIITVLNKMFDEDNKEYYIGNTNKLYPIHTKTNFVLNVMNRYNKYATRKNKGISMLPKTLPDPPMNLNRSLLKNKRKNIDGKRVTRKIRRYSL